MLNQKRPCFKRATFYSKEAENITLLHYYIIIYLNKATWVKNSFQS